MSITPELEIELARFPAALRFLIEAELASGNAIIEVGHSFPAPPIGAYLKLAKKVSSRARADGDGLSFYERNNSIYSGEFTDTQRFYFVIEPPNPPPAEPDMDVVRKSIDPKTNVQKIDLPTNRSQDIEEGLHVEKRLESIAAIQQTIISAFKDGARICDSHKEGGTNIYWKGGRFVRSDYGDFPDEQHFTDEIEFLKTLRQFCHWDATRNSDKDQLSEVDIWRLILRRMNL